jgi:hypothetical protein
MSQASSIAQRTIVTVDSSGNEALVTLAIGSPYEVSAGHWACPVRLDGMYEQLYDQHGIDSWQSMQLAWQLIAQLLGYFVERGGRLLWVETRAPIEVSELIPRLKAKQ